MNLANDLLRKAGGYIHTMPHKPAQYVDEDGMPTTNRAIAVKYKVTPAKVKLLFDKYEYQEVYRLINIDGRAGNGQRGVYNYPDGSPASYDKLAKFYGISSATVQRAWRVNGKDSVLANKYLASKSN